MVTELFFFILLGTLLGNGIATETSSSVSIFTDAMSNDSGSIDSMFNADGQNNKKELVDRVKDLEVKFQQHISESKAEREDQYEKIAILNADKKSQEEKFQLVLDEMEALKAQNRDQTERMEKLEETLKTKAATSSIQSNTKPKNRNSTLPSSCQDLKSQGHNLNGIYMVFDAIKKKVLATYCDFHQSSKIRTAIGNRVIGSLGINTLVGGVYFYAQMKNTFKETGKIVPFDRILVNQGNGLSLLNKGVFTAPRAGIYHFTFKGITVFNTHLVIIQIRHNGVVVGDAAIISGLLHVHATLKLKSGDRVYLFKLSGGDLVTDETPDIHFSGWLLEEDVYIKM